MSAKEMFTVAGGILVVLALCLVFGYMIIESAKDQESKDYIRRHACHTIDADNKKILICGDGEEYSR